MKVSLLNTNAFNETSETPKLIMKLLTSYLNSTYTNGCLILY